MIQSCQQCQHFHQHYVLNDYQCIRVNFGHCAKDEIRVCSPDGEACEGFLARSASDQKPTDLHFFTEELIKRLLAYRFPPDEEGHMG